MRPPVKEGLLGYCSLLLGTQSDSCFLIEKDGNIVPWNWLWIFTFYLLVEKNGTITTESPSEDPSADEPSAKKAKLEVPVAQTFEVSEVFRSGNDSFS